MKYPGMFFLVVCMVFSNAAWAEKPVSEMVTVENPFARATAPGMPMSGAFMTILNHGETRLLHPNPDRPQGLHDERVRCRQK